MPVKIPVNLVPRAFIDYDMEQHQILGHAFCLPDGFRVPPLTAARLMALELVCSDFFLHPGACTQLDAAAALVLMSCDRALVAELTADRFASGGPSAAQDAQTTTQVEASASSPRGLSAYPELYAAASSFLNAHADAMLADYPRLVRWCIEVPFYGFDMLPKSAGGQPHECWFDGEFAGSVIAQASKILATPVDTVLWETPLCLVWHAVAQHAAAYGVKHVERPPDEAILKAMMQEAADREARGELHPWQYTDPLAYGLTDAQAQANPALIGLFSRMRAEYERNGHKPLDPAAFPVSCASEAERTAQVEAPASCLPGMRATISNQDIFINV